MRRGEHELVLHPLQAGALGDVADREHRAALLRAELRGGDRQDRLALAECAAPRARSPASSRSMRRGGTSPETRTSRICGADVGRREQPPRGGVGVGDDAAAHRR